MHRYRTLLMAGLLTGFVAPAAAQAPNAFTTADLNMRAGPSSDFPVVTTIPEDAQVRVFGCIDGYAWCDVGWDGTRGWAYAAYLTYPYQDRRVIVREYGPQIDLPIISFSVGSYWDEYYRGRPWYANRSRWAGVWRGHRDRRGWRRDRDRGEWRRDRDRDHGDRKRRARRDGDDNRREAVRERRRDRAADRSVGERRGNRSDRAKRFRGGDSDGRRAGRRHGRPSANVRGRAGAKVRSGRRGGGSAGVGAGAGSSSRGGGEGFRRHRR